MHKDKKNNIISNDDELWNNITKNDKKYIKSNRFVTKNVNSVKKKLNTKKL